jgi:hypothetical protein
MHSWHTILQLERWLTTMRGAQGYGGPVVHWWRHCWQYAGAGLDWRYEGIIIGYVNLFRHTQQHRWLHKACAAADDLIMQQGNKGNWPNSGFELNPISGGTPHEFAAAHGLLVLAELLREQSDPQWQKYLASARRNLLGYGINQLWDKEAGYVRDHPYIRSFVPNKGATFAEGLFLLSKLTGDEQYARCYGLPIIEAILAHQVQEGPMVGAIAQNSFGVRVIAKYFPYYIARCVPALVAAYEFARDERYLAAALQAIGFVLRWREDDGSLPQVIYPDGRINRYPQWVAATGDLLIAMQLLVPYGAKFEREPSERWLCNGIKANGAVATAHGFARQRNQRLPVGLPALHDSVPVCGWVDKAFRYLTGCNPTLTGSSVSETPPLEQDCLLNGKPVCYREDAHQMEVFDPRGRLLYHWVKGEDWARVADERIFWK